MDLLILGGTVFVGRGVAEEAIARGHRVTLFHRGTKGTGLVPGAEEILGDRDGGLDALGGRSWDAVVDACGYVPRLVGDSARALAGSGRYLFVSTISVYEVADGALRERPVETPVGTEDVTGETYGALKVECERAVVAEFGERATLVRPGLVAGPHDPTGRFPYWVGRFLGGSPVLVPDVPDAPLQQIDARDLGRFCARLLEDDRAGTFDAVGEASTFGAMIDACVGLAPGARPRPVRLDALARAGVELGRDLPLAAPEAGPFMRIEPKNALAAGLERRPFAETLRDTAAWVAATPEAALRAGLSREREREILDALEGGAFETDV